LLEPTAINTYLVRAAAHLANATALYAMIILWIRDNRTLERLTLGQGVVRSVTPKVHLLPVLLRRHILALIYCIDGVELITLL